MTKNEFKEKMFAKLVERNEFKEEERSLFMKEYETLQNEFGLFLEIVNEREEFVRNEKTVNKKESKGKKTK